MAGPQPPPAGAPGGPAGAPGGPAGAPAQASTRTIATFSNYADAQRAVDFLSDRHFPVERVSIVGRGLEYVEQVTGRLTTGRAALQGAGQGALLGLVFALLLGLFFTVAAAYLALLVYGVVVGAVLGALLGALTHAAAGGERDFSGVQAMRARSYEVMVEAEVADEASRLLAELEPASTASSGADAGAIRPAAG
jgi:hypothetical protein